MFMKIKRRKLRYEIALDVTLLASYRDIGTSLPKHRFVKQSTIRSSDWKRLNRRQWFLKILSHPFVTYCGDN